MTEGDADLEHSQGLQPIQSLLLNLGASVDKAFRHEIVHLLSVEAERTHVSVQYFAGKNNKQLNYLWEEVLMLSKFKKNTRIRLIETEGLETKEMFSLTIKSFLTREARTRARRSPSPPSSVASRSPKRLE